MPVLTFKNAHTFLPSGTKERLLLVTVYALSVNYCPVDISLAVSSGMLPLLSKLCGTPLAISPLHHMLSHTGQSQLSLILMVSAFRLLQIISVTAGLVYFDSLIQMKLF